MNEIPVEVQNFLDAVAQIPTEITADNVESVSELVYGVCADTYEVLLGTDYENRPDVKDAYSIMEKAIQTINKILKTESDVYSTPPLSGYTAHDIFYYNGSPECYLYLDIYPNSPVESQNIYAGRINKFVGENGFYSMFYTKKMFCPRCGSTLTEHTTEWITVAPNRGDYFINSDPTIIKNEDITWDLAENIYAQQQAYKELPALFMNFKASKPGETSLNFYTWYEYYFNDGSGYCDYCGQYCTNIRFNGWVERIHSMDVTVNARYQLKYDTQGGTSINSSTKDASETQVSFPITSTIPTKDGYTFVYWQDDEGNIYKPTENGWVDGNNNEISSDIVIDWKEGFGSKDNPVTKTLHAIWEEDLSNYISITKKASENNPYVGDEFFYTLQVINRASNGKKVTIVDILDERLKFIACGDGGIYDSKTHTVTWSDVTVPGNGNKQITLYVEAKETGEIPNTAKVFYNNSLVGEDSVTINIIAHIPVTYRVEWYDKKENTLKETQYRTGIEDETVTPQNTDYVIDGYIFDKTDNRNILSKELKEDEENVLKLYFYKPIVNLHLTKTIKETTLFDKLNLQKDDAYKFHITLTNKETGDKIRGILNNKTELLINDLPVGVYEIEESDDMYFNYINMETLNSVEGITFEKDENSSNYILTILGSTLEKRDLEIKVNNETEPDRFYEDKKENNNLFNFDTIIPKQITVKWIDGLYDTPIKTEIIDKGSSIQEDSYPNPPNHEGYEFIGWSKPSSIIDDVITITANYSELTVQTYIVEWCDENGNRLQQITLQKGTAEPPYEGPTPTKDEDENYTYEFKEWIKMDDSTEDYIKYKATFTQILKSN